jgi:hypothetical protein
VITVAASIPKGRVKRLKPEFDRRKHLGPVTRPQAVARLNTDAELMRLRQVAALQGRAG